MLTRTSSVATPEKFYNYGMNETPTFASSVYDSLASGIATPVVMLNMMDADFAKKPEGRAALDQLEAINLERQAPNMGWGQWLADEGANMIGYGLNPITWAFGAAGGVAGRLGTGALGRGLSRVLPDAAGVFMRKPLSEVLTEPVGRYIPSMIGKEGAKKTLSAALIGEKGVEAFAAGAGAGVPAAIVANYNRDTNHIEWGGVARDSAEMGGLGLAIGAIPFGWGILRGKINRAKAEEPMSDVNAKAMNDAFEAGHITPEEHKLGMDYLNNLKNPDEAMTADIQQRFTKMIGENGHKTNTVSNEALFDVLTGDDVSNLHGAIADQLASSHLPEDQRFALSNYIVHNRMDFFRKDPKSLDGLRGYVDFVNQKLANKNPKLLEANKILDDHLMKSIKENMPFSQKELLKMMRQSGFESSHVAHLPVTIPENLRTVMRMTEKLNKLKEKVRKEKRRGLEPNKQTMRRIDEIKEKMPKALTPKEELQDIREKLLTEKGLPPDWNRTKEYHRLVDLSHVWKNADTLLDRIHLEHEYNRQEAFSKLADTVLKLSDSDGTVLAKPENVMDYLRTRVEGLREKVPTLEEVNASLAAKEKLPPDIKQVLTEQEQQARKSKAEKSKEDFDATSERLKEFQSKQDIFKQLISCILGGFRG